MDLIQLFDPEHVSSLILFITFIGAGVWFGRSAWPWLTGFLEHKQELEYDIQKQRLVLQAESDQRWQTTTAAMATNFAELKGVLEAFRAAQNNTNANLERLFRYLVRVNGNGSDESGESL